MKLSECTRYVKYAKLKAYRHRRTFALVGMSIVLTLILMAKHENTVRYISSDMERVSSQQVWEYVSDFSNMVNLNPTIKKFIITHELSNDKQWNYTVEYEEHLSQLPFVTNKIVGDFVVEETQSRRTIKSTHRTCFSRIYCLNTQSEMQFLDLPKGSRVLEMIKYECPWLLTRFCSNEVMYQRKEIFGRLRTVFAHTKHL